MSYILEALKKSQQERELGRVPTLDASGIFDEDKVAPPRGHWPLVAVVLASVAMLLALYAALRGPASTPVTAADAPQVAGAAGWPPGGAGTPTTGTLPAYQPATPATLVGLEPTPPTTMPQGPSAGSPPQVARPQPTATNATPSPQPLVQPPPPKRSGRIRLADPTESSVNGEDPDGDDAEPVRGRDAEVELELQRQMEAEEEWIAAEDAYAAPAPTPVPRDLIADIESFKREVRGGNASETPREQPLSRPIDEAPERLRLTPAQVAELPAYLMSVHVYDRERSRRFVVINGLRYREGETTREGLRVERVLAEGAVLSHKGNPFFVAR